MNSPLFESKFQCVEKLLLPSEFHLILIGNLIMRYVSRVSDWKVGKIYHSNTNELDRVQ
jgi:hypothetical protein